MTLSVTAEAFTGPPRVLVNVASSPSEAGLLIVWRTHEDGSRHRVLTSGQAVLNGTWSGYDYHMPLNELVTYSAQTVGGVESAPSSGAWVSSDLMWLVHPSDSALSFAVGTVVSAKSRSKPARTQTFQILNDPLPVIRPTNRRGPQSGDLQVLTDGMEETGALESLLADGGPVLLNSHRKDALPWMWVQFGDVQIEPPGGYFNTDLRLVSLPWQECSAPMVDVRPVWTYADLRAEFAASTNAGLPSVFASYADMRLNIRIP